MNPASQDRTCPVRTALHMALQGMGSWGDGSEVGESHGRGQKRGRGACHQWLCVCQGICAAEIDLGDEWKAHPTPSTEKCWSFKHTYKSPVQDTARRSSGSKMG